VIVTAAEALDVQRRSNAKQEARAREFIMGRHLSDSGNRKKASFDIAVRAR
jgi:hypothetical protein